MHKRVHWLAVDVNEARSLIGSSSLCKSNADYTSCRHCTYEIELLRLLGSGHILT